MTTAVQNSNPCLQAVLAAPQVGQSASPFQTLSSRVQALWRSVGCLLRQAQAYAALVALPGVGRKTANVVRGHAFRLPGFPVDRHVLRVATRIGLLKGKATEDAVAAETTLTKLLPPERWTRASDTLILHGRRICKPKPLCERCTIRPHCAYYRLHGPGHVSR